MLACLAFRAKKNGAARQARPERLRRMQLFERGGRPHGTYTVEWGDDMILRSGKHLARAVWTALAVAAAPVAGAAPTLTPVGPIDTSALSMSADGSVIVGTHIFGLYAYRWTREGGTEILGGNGGNTKVSRDGTTITGNALVDGHNEAAIWLGGRDWQPLGGFADSGCPDFSNSYGINEDGSVIVGLGWDGCQARAFRWDENAGMADLGSFIVGRSSRANAVNADGSVIVGWDDAEDGSRRGARWVNGVESLLAAPGGAFLGGAEAVTPDGRVVVGGNAGGLQYNQAYRWTEEHGGELIGMLPNDDPLAGAYAFAVSDDGRIVGGASGAEGREAFLWTRTTGMFKFQDYLADLGAEGLDGWILDTILAISSDGTRIAGWGYRGQPPFGRVQGFVVEGLPPFADTDADSVLDPVDNCTLLRNADQRDTDGDLYGNRCDPDFDNDGIVDRDDLDYLRSVFGTADPDGDLDGDGIVGPRDLAILRDFRGAPPGPSGRVE
jgi:probable HAF family extracellular repeat protein